MTFIWVARGRSWGFRFLRTGGITDALAVYESVFDSLDLEADSYRAVGTRGALRLRDPDQRLDRSGRPITHDFVLLGDTAASVQSVEDGLRIVWPEVSDEYSRIWALPDPPASES
ncbi:hypothetical protein A4X16_06890 [Microbacterium sp. H83]|nr:hypothetical protein A4X16_06890 [Microbacterium sp. H83]